MYTVTYIETEESPYTFSFFLVNDKIQELRIDGNEERADLLEEQNRILRNLLEKRRVAKVHLDESDDTDIQKKRRFP